jgi:hypothetical protein
MKDLIKKILREEVNKRFIRGTDAAKSIIIKHMEKIISNTTRVTPPTEENYGNYNEEWCKGDKIIIEARYHFMDDGDNRNIGPDYVEDVKFFAGDLYVDKEEIDYLSKILQVRKTFIFNVITEWYDEKYTTKFGQEIGHPEIEIDETHESDDWRKCYQMVNTDNISREEMINYLYKNALYRISELEGLSDYDLKSRYRSVYNIKSNDI